MKKNFFKVMTLFLTVSTIVLISVIIVTNDNLENVKNDYEALANEESFKDEYYTNAIQSLQERNDNQVKIIKDLQK